MRTRSRPLRFVLAAVLFAAAVRAGDDPLLAYRERFQQGLDRFRAGDVAGAVQYWEPIRKELGDAKAYRLLYNLGKAYEVLGDATMAADRYEGFLREALERPEAAEPKVLEQARDAEVRLAELKRTRARVRVTASERPGLVRIDAGEPRLGPHTAYLAPGRHTIALDPGTPGERRVEVDIKPGEQVDFDPTRAAPAPAPVPVPAAVPAVSASSRAAPKPVAPPAQHVTDHPFPPEVLYVAGGVSLLSILAPVLAYRHARGIADEYGDPATSIERRRVLRDDYNAAKKTYAWSWAIPGVCLGATAGLTTWYLAGSKERVVAVQGGAGPGGGWVEVQGRF
jgi:hypothetical protein